MLLIRLDFLAANPENWKVSWYKTSSSSDAVKLGVSGLLQSDNIVYNDLDGRFSMSADHFSGTVGNSKSRTNVETKIYKTFFPFWRNSHLYVGR